MAVEDPQVRYKRLSSVKSKDTAPEMVVRKFLYSKGIRYRLHSKSLPGKPDIVIRRIKTIIFVNGCFWHRHKGCKFAYSPKSNTEFWNKKFKDNVKRDNNVNNELKGKGWKVIKLWECEIKNGLFKENISCLS